MNSLIFLSIGLVLLILLWVAGRRRSADSSGAPGAVPDPSEYLVQLPRGSLMARCLSEEDVTFIESLGSPGVCRLFLAERRRLALQWLRLTRREATRLFGLHVRTARYAPDLRPSTEAKLVVQFATFWLIYEVLVGLVSLYGPFRTHSYVGSIESLAELLSGLGGRIAASIGPAPAERLQAAPGE